MSRLSYVPASRMNDAQRALFEEITGGKRAAAAKGRSLLTKEGGLTGPFNAWLHAPETGRAWSALGEAMRFHTGLDRRLFELAVVVTASHWRSGHEWVAHSALGRDAGLGDETIAAIGRGEEPEFAKNDERIVYRFASEMLRGSVSAAAYDDARALLGEEQLVELAGAVSYYTALALSMHAFAVDAPEGYDHPWRTKGTT